MFIKKKIFVLWDIAGVSNNTDLEGYYENAFGVVGNVVSGCDHQMLGSDGNPISHKTEAVMKSRILSQTSIVDISNQGVIIAENNLGVNTTD